MTKDERKELFEYLDMALDMMGITQWEYDAEEYAYHEKMENLLREEFNDVINV